MLVNLAAVAGLAHHPLQQMWSGEATTKSLVTGVGLGLVGVVTKPLSGAAELVALTGQGLLQGAGWNSLPTVNLSNDANVSIIRIPYCMPQSDPLYIVSDSHVKGQSCSIPRATTARLCDTRGVCRLCSITVTIVFFM